MVCMKKLSLVFGAAGLLFAGSAMALPQTKYTSSCKPLAPTEGQYEEGKGVGTISSESAFKKITAGNEAYADGKYNESITILKDYGFIKPTKDVALVKFKSAGHLH